MFRLLLLILFIGCVTVSACTQTHQDQASSGMILMAADDIDRVLGDIQASTRAVALEYERFFRAEPKAGADDVAERKVYSVRKGKTTQFNSWGGDKNPPSYQNPTPAYYAYVDSPQSEHYRKLAIFDKLSAVVRAAYNTFDFSWTYVTTNDGMMLLYPFLTIEEAVNNYPPTQQVFYTSADFDKRQGGWTPPYLDLAGAGMMVTVSWPAFDGDNIIGVASHDITLDQLSSRVLQRMAMDGGAITYIVDREGLVIGVSDSALAKELRETNQSAKGAVLRYRQSSKQDRFTVSATDWINELTEQLLKQVNADANGKVLQATSAGYQGVATGTQHAGWLVIYASPLRK